MRKKKNTSFFRKKRILVRITEDDDDDDHCGPVATSATARRPSSWIGPTAACLPLPARGPRARRPRAAAAVMMIYRGPGHAPATVRAVQVEVGSPLGWLALDVAPMHGDPVCRLQMEYWSSYAVGMKMDRPVPFSIFFRPFSYLRDPVFIFAEVENGVFRSFPSNPVLIRNRPVFIPFLSRFQFMLNMFNNYMSLCYVNITTNYQICMLCSRT
jgi:hypothetical protein